MAVMTDEIALSVFLSPVGVMLALAIASAVLSVRAWRAVANSARPDALAGLFHRGDFAERVRDPKLRHIQARGQQRTARRQPYLDPRQREAMLHQVAAVMRGTERDDRIVREATRYLAGEGFVILENVAKPARRDDYGDVVEIVDFEEVKLLPPPSPAKAA